MITKLEIDHISGNEAVFFTDTTELGPEILQRITAKTGLKDMPEWFALEVELTPKFDGAEFDGVQVDATRLQVRNGNDLHVVYLNDDEVDTDDLAAQINEFVSPKTVSRWYEETFAMAY